MDAPLYLDHAATTPPLLQALAAFQHAVERGYANPSSLHQAGAAAARMVEKARRGLQEALGAHQYRVIWTATGTEGNHLGIQGLARAKKSLVTAKGGIPRVLVGAVEHPSSLQAALALAEEGFQVEVLPADQHGMILPATLQAALSPEVVLVSLQWANNELGTLQPIRSLVSLCRRLAPQAAFHCDAVQAVGKCADALDALGADSYSVAAHKLGGVRGCAAFLLHEDCVAPKPLFVGGGHERGLRSGTENTMGIAAFVAAAKVRHQWLLQNPHYMRDRRRFFLQELQQALPSIQVLGPDKEEDCLGAILAIAIPHIRAETFLHMLESKGVFVGSGSACHTHGHKESAVLQAIQLNPDLRNCVLRISFGGTETDDCLRYAATAFSEVATNFR